MNSRDQHILKLIYRRILEKDPAAEVILYGSRARGTQKEESDWDLLILLNRQSISFDLETRFMDELYEIELETGEVISPLIYAKKDWADNHSVTPLFENIQKEGIRIK